MPRCSTNRQQKQQPRFNWDRFCKLGSFTSKSRGITRIPAPVALRRKTTMGSSPCLLCATLLGSLFTGVVLSGNGGTQQAESINVVVRQKGKLVSLHCEGGNVIKWSKDGYDVLEGGQELSLGSSLDDPQGVYTCHTNNREASLQVYFQMCQNCVQLDLPTVLGLLLASTMGTVFLAVAVYCLATEEPGWRLQASDKQTLLANEQLYQPLGERNNGQYSHIGVANMRRR